MVRSAGEGEWGGKGYYTIALTPRQYRSHMERNRGWPPRSQLLTHPFRNQLFAPAKKKVAPLCKRQNWKVERGSKPFQGNMALLYSLHIKSHCRNRTRVTNKNHLLVIPKLRSPFAFFYLQKNKSSRFRKTLLVCKLSALQVQ